MFGTATLAPVFADNHLRTVMARDTALYLDGTLRQEPERLAQRTRWQVSAERIWHPTGAEEISGYILIGLRVVRREWRYGDRVRLRVRPQLPQDSGNPGGFNYATYLARREIYATAFLDSDQEVELVAREAGAVRGFVEDLRRRIRIFIDRNVAPENGAFSALVVATWAARKRPVAHYGGGRQSRALISGLHVAMLGLVVFVAIRYGLSLSGYLLLRWNLLKVATFFSFLAVLFYTALAGAMVPTVRSAIMIGVYELAVLLDREEEVFTSLTLAALLIALVWPGVIAIFLSAVVSRGAVHRLGLAPHIRLVPPWQERRAAARKKPDQRNYPLGLHALGGTAAGDPRNRAVDRALFWPSVAGGIHRQSADRAAGRFRACSGRTCHRVLRRHSARRDIAAGLVSRAAGVLDRLAGRSFRRAAAGEYHCAGAQSAGSRSTLRVYTLPFSAARKNANQLGCRHSSGGCRCRRDVLAA
jgi:hypothetical protein